MYTDKCIYSGATGDPATNRAASATTTADPSYPPAICEHGHDPSDSTSCTRRRIPYTAADAESITTKRLSVSQSDAATAANKWTNGCPYTTFITSS
jgi:hypothetical protein